MKSKYLILLLALSACAPTLPVYQAPARLEAQSVTRNWGANLSPELQRYYAPALGKTGRPLLEALSQLSNQARVLDYGDATAFLYQQAEALKPGVVRAAYSGVGIEGDGPSGHKYKEQDDANGDGKKGDSINCEHTWPQSFFGKTGAMRTDLHHLFATLSTPNSQRGHHPFGEAREGRLSYATQSGSKLAMRPNGKGVFEPDNSQKGNTARAVLYFYLRYHTQAIRQGDYRSQDYFTNRLPLFERWMQLDPADAQEKQRHERIAQKQGNRNPFVDIPQLGQLIGFETLAQVENQYFLKK